MVCAEQATALAYPQLNQCGALATPVATWCRRWGLHSKATRTSPHFLRLGPVALPHVLANHVTSGWIGVFEVEGHGCGFSCPRCRQQCADRLAKVQVLLLILTLTPTTTIYLTLTLILTLSTQVHVRIRVWTRSGFRLRLRLGRAGEPQP